MATTAKIDPIKHLSSGPGGRSHALRDAARLGRFGHGRQREYRGERGGQRGRHQNGTYMGELSGVEVFTYLRCFS